MGDTYRPIGVLHIQNEGPHHSRGSLVATTASCTSSPDSQRRSPSDLHFQPNGNVSVSWSDHVVEHTQLEPQPPTDRPPTAQATEGPLQRRALTSSPARDSQGVDSETVSLPQMSQRVEERWTCVGQRVEERCLGR